jgi:multisubunit Na+/H+ antiporter MnhC subunit
MNLIIAALICWGIWDLIGQRHKIKAILKRKK